MTLFFFPLSEKVFGRLALGDVHRHVQQILRLSFGVPDYRKPSVGNEQAPISANETLFPRVIIPRSLK